MTPRSLLLLLLSSLCFYGGRSDDGITVSSYIKSIKDAHLREPFRMVDALNRTVRDKGRWSSPDDRAALLEALGDALVIVKRHDEAVKHKVAALSLREAAAQPTTSSITQRLLSNVAIVDAAVNGQQFAAAREHLARARALLRDNKRETHSSTVGLLRVEAAIEDCTGDVRLAANLMATSLGLSRAVGGGETGHLEGHVASLKGAAASVLKMHTDYLTILWRLQAVWEAAGDPASAVTVDAAAGVAPGAHAHAAGSSLVTRECVDAEVAHISELLLASGKWGTSPLQLPKYFLAGLTSRPWHTVAAAEDHGGQGGGSEGAYRGFPELRAAQQAIRRAHASLVAEYRTLKSRGLLLPETECIQSMHAAPSDAATSWMHYTVNGHWLRPEELDARGCSLAAPAACSLAVELEKLASSSPRLRLMRMGYSAIGPRVSLRRHCGLTNAQLKFHLGLVIPKGSKGYPCANLTVGGESRSWQEGKTLLFDDSYRHSVENECDDERVVFQVVISHPEKQAPPRNLGGQAPLFAAGARDE